MFPEASSCFIKAAEAAQKAKDTHTEASMYVEAGNCVRRYSVAAAAPVFEKGIKLLLAANRVAAAAKVHRQLAEDWEAAGDAAAAAANFLAAAELFDSDEFSKTQYSHCICKYAELVVWGAEAPAAAAAAAAAPAAAAAAAPAAAAAAAATLEKAAKIFETEGYKASQNNLLQFGAKDLFLNSLLLLLAAAAAREELVDLQLALARYRDCNAHFAASREQQLLQQLLAAAEDRDPAAFAAAVEDFDKVSRLSPWRVHFLLKAKQQIEQQQQQQQQQQQARGAPHMLPAVGDDGELDLS
ncbi:alpha-soluble NSF attachment protein, putative [Eimeria necatrix]|uniref:Alpha-soluble NSF attachment protein, putative n=1 Tax=Eimeria necatrix TaxID=51315 RepID=U6MMJ8_9EIME|nr:alpha-soluble NSF attachment protein, putative [Eimeria necatrix]CDJ65241.1 alpha-soluble NSF attachment protein, putative [Eimeria necatrix]